MIRTRYIVIGAAAVFILAALVLPVPKTWIDLSHMGPSAASSDKQSNTTYRDTSWDDLIPKGWDPTKRFLNGQMNLSDSNPRAMELLRDMRATWDNAPTVDTLNGAAVRLPGYVVPLDQTKTGMKQFLLVPYFGACIHTPPPPANQIVDVLIDRPVEGLQMMDAVWVSGTLKTLRNDSLMGRSGHQLQAVRIEHYEPPKK